MRSEKEMMDMILKIAEKDERIRAVGMNGSRTNINAPKDPFQDFDIVYLVTDMRSFIDDPDWVNVFGERIIMQTPENMAMFPPELGARFSYLILFTDGNRIDIILAPIEEKDDYCTEDTLTVILLDKDNSLPTIPPPSDQQYWVKRPSAEYFADCWNEFWWVCTYVAKGLWRREMLYAQDHMNLVRAMLIQMLEWKVGIETNYSVSIGKSGKYLDQFLSKNTWQKVLSTYADAHYDHVWHALFAMIELFQETASFVANTYLFTYPAEEEQRVMHYLQHVRNLPHDATEIY